MKAENLNNDMIPVGTTVHINPEDIKWEVKGDLISREALKNAFTSETRNIYEFVCLSYVLEKIDNAPSVEETEEPFITECRDTAIEENLPLYFVYYEEAGILEVYVTETKELFEKRRCSKHLLDYKFKEAVIKYLDWYSDWKRGTEE